MRYIIAPLDLTTEQREIYFLLYSRMDFSTFKVKYTLDQLALDSNSKLNLTKKKVSKIIKDFIDVGYLEEIEKGSRGKPTLYRIITIKEQIGNESVTNRELLGTNREQISVENTSVEPCSGTNRELLGTNRERIGNESVTPINDKEKEKKKKEKTFSSDSIEYGLSYKLFDKMRLNNPNVKEPNFQLWAKHIDAMIRIDKRQVEDIEKVIDWCQLDVFWKCNILSTAKLREKFDQLAIKAIPAKSKNIIRRAADF